MNFFNRQWLGRTLLLVMAAVGAVCLSGCGDKGAEPKTTYAVTVSSAGTGASGGGNYAEGATVAISAGTAPADRQFKTWTSSSGGVAFADANNATTTFVMPANDVTVTAVFEPKGATPATYAVTVSSAGTETIGGGSYAAGATVIISAGTAPAGQQFKNWASSSNGVIFANANSATTTFIMPTNAVTVTAVFEPQSGVTPTTYAVTVSSAGTGAIGGGSYAAGATVAISAGTAPTGQQFAKWTSSTNGVIFADENKATTTFIMPANAVTVTAAFEPQVVTPTTYAVTVSSAGTGAIGGGNYIVGSTVSISAGTTPSGQQFKKWTSSSNGVVFADENSAITTFVMPANAVTVTAVFEQQSVTPSIYSVTVSSAGTEATGGGSYAVGATVAISAGTAPDGQRFKKWTSTDGVNFGDAGRATTAFLMPAKNVTVTAVFESITFVDIRDISTYKTVKIAGKTWMAENLKYEPTTGSTCYGGSADSCEKYGRLYNWNTAMANAASSDKSPSGVQGVCPAGWHLPSHAEWIELAVAAGGVGTEGTSGTAGKALKATTGWNWAGSYNGNGTDDFGFSALPSGIRQTTGGFSDIGNYGYWWTATAASSTAAVYRYMSNADERVFANNNSKDYMFSIRCVRDD
jgi:uncharacterized protein (TIGR02145 family)